jgi:hypothetical protein
MGRKNRSCQEPVRVEVLNIRSGIEGRIEASNAEDIVNTKVRYAVEWKGPRLEYQNGSGWCVWKPEHTRGWPDIRRQTRC